GADAARTGHEARIVPFARLRPGTRLAERVHIGNFVETRQAGLGAGTKANHLTYLGDCVIGPDTNVGAGTITCNYDGFKKHRTRIGARVQIGSDTQLVAPVTVGDDAYVGAGTTVTRNVPPGGVLVVSRVPQRHVEGWVARRRRATAGAKPKATVTTVPRQRAPKAARGRKMASETDTEVISHLIDEHVREGCGLFEATRRAIAQLEGSYAIVVLSESEPDRLVAAKSATPIVIGLGEGENFVASDIPA